MKAAVTKFSALGRCEVVCGQDREASSAAWAALRRGTERWGVVRVTTHAMLRNVVRTAKEWFEARRVGRKASKRVVTARSSAKEREREVETY